jgi:hypothetical protein
MPQLGNYSVPLEGLMKTLMGLILFLLVLPAGAETTATEEKVVGVFYFKPILGHVHQSAKRTSTSLTTIQCSHPLKVIESSKVSVGSEWAYVQVADYRGFVLKEYLASKRPECFQGKYPKFFDAFNFDLSELYYWGRLYDQYYQSETRVQ